MRIMKCGMKLLILSKTNKGPLLDEDNAHQDKISSSDALCHNPLFLEVHLKKKLYPDKYKPTF